MFHYRWSDSTCSVLLKSLSRRKALGSRRHFADKKSHNSPNGAAHTVVVTVKTLHDQERGGGRFLSNSTFPNMNRPALSCWSPKWLGCVTVLLRWEKTNQQTKPWPPFSISSCSEAHRTPPHGKRPACPGSSRPARPEDDPPRPQPAART